MSPVSRDRCVVLASRSRIRAELLRNAGVAFEVVSADVDESAVIAALVSEGRPPEEIAAAVAARKADAVAATRSGGVVIAADQLLFFRGTVLQKAMSREEGRSRLEALAGATHDLVTGYAVYADGVWVDRGAERVTVSMRAVSSAFLDGFVARNRDSLLDSVTCYEIEGDGVQMIDRMEGDYFSALGLPLLPVLAALRSIDVLES